MVVFCQILSFELSQYVKALCIFCRVHVFLKFSVLKIINTPIHTTNDFANHIHTYTFSMISHKLQIWYIAFCKLQKQTTQTSCILAPLRMLLHLPLSLKTSLHLSSAMANRASWFSCQTTIVSLREKYSLSTIALTSSQCQLNSHSIIPKIIHSLSDTLLYPTIRELPKGLQLIAKVPDIQITW